MIGQYILKAFTVINRINTFRNVLGAIIIALAVGLVAPSWMYVAAIAFYVVKFNIAWKEIPMAKRKPRHTETYVRITTASGTEAILTRAEATHVRDRFPDTWGAGSMVPATEQEWLSA